ncbi:hypothetical protein [Streptomyces coffeae]|uniref:Uncharacterized protein n=1 Tax=Streptomyces coffeae TaxID=621382 RepID=A0ABS1NJM5_9ACTN|nr:hypothetical protein [Streptomyces coffeae]MBL1100170.1 hypothetical protein [Streptomyces coffeae]
MTADPLNSWAPPNTTDVEMVEVGHHWDAVSAPTAIADRALKLLDARSGAVIQDDLHGKVYWLIAVDTARSWCLRRVSVLTSLLDESTLLGVPPATWTADRYSYWRIPLAPGRYLTDAQQLHRALAQAADEALGPVPEGRQLCYRCQLPTDEPVIVAEEHGGSIGGGTTYACPQHAQDYPADTVARLVGTRHAPHQDEAR